MVVFGGQTIDGATTSNVNSYDIGLGAWQLSKPVSVGTGGSKPSARKGHTAVCLENKMIVFGNDLLIYFVPWPHSPPQPPSPSPFLMVASFTP